jgi:hypothetical protein
VANEPKFRDREHVIDRLVSQDGATYDRWAWLILLAQLDRAGYAIVKKPELTETGKANRAGPRPDK